MNMKKNLFFLISVLGLLFLFTDNNSVKAQTAVQNSSSEKVAPIDNGVDQVTYEQNIQGTTSISLDQYLQKVANGDKFIVYIGFKECPHCRNFSPVLKEFTKTAKQPVYYLDYGPTGSFSTSTQTSIQKFYTTFNQPFEFAGTPTLALFNKTKLVSMAVGDDTTINDLDQILSDSLLN